MKSYLSTILLLLVFSCSAYSCRCLILHEFGKVLDDNDQIFIGKAVSKFSNDSQTTFSFEVKKKWKGEMDSTIEISTSLGDCKFDFVINSTYIVYAKNAFTNICRRTNLLENSFDERLLDHYFHGKSINKKLDAQDYEVIKNRLNMGDMKIDKQFKYSVVFDYRVISPKEIYHLHPKYFAPNKLSLYTLDEKEKDLVGNCVDKIVTIGTYIPPKGWSRKKIVNIVKRRKVCKG